MTVFLVAALVKVALFIGLAFGVAAYATLAERKIAGWIQNRYGPNRVGPWGLLQPMADGIKLFFKEELLPAGANPFLFKLAPALVTGPALLAVAVIPLGDTLTVAGEKIPLVVADMPVGVLYLLAVTSLSVYGILLGGWASNNKYSLLGGLRSAAQVVSYELTLVLAMATVLLFSGTMSTRGIALAQEGLWNVFRFPVGTAAFFLFWIASFAETNRLPFDMVECEPELVGGYHTEYSSMRFALFFLGEYVAMFVQAAMLTTLFLGGYTLFGLEKVLGNPVLNVLAGAAIFLAKTFFFLFVFIWVRWTLPRVRWDQLMGLGWKVLLPIAMVTVLAGGAGVIWGVY